MRVQHPAVEVVLDSSESELSAKIADSNLDETHTTSLSLARALAIGCISGLDPNLASVDVWDPTAGSGLAGFTLANALNSAGVHVRYRGQDLNYNAAATCRRRLENVADTEVATGNTLERDQFSNLKADLVIVDPPWGVSWASSASAVESRTTSGAFGFGVPQRTDSTWLFISLALEKLRPAMEGGGRVAALVSPSTLSTGGASADVRERIVEAGLLESVTRLPEGLAPNTSIPLYLLTFSVQSKESQQKTAKIADLQTQFTTERRRRAMPVSALRELEFGLRTGKPGPRNRSVDVRQFIRRDARLFRVVSGGHRLSWRLSTYNNTVIDDSMLASRYGADSGISVDNNVQEILDLNPKYIFVDDSRELVKEIEAKGWLCRRLSGLIAGEPFAIKDPANDIPEGSLLIPTSQSDTVTVQLPDSSSDGRLLSIQLSGNLLQPSFLAAWLNSDHGRVSRRRAIETSSSGTYVKALRSDSSSLMRWADELIVPVPERSVQVALASADEQLGSFQAELSTQRETLWSAPDTVEEVVHRLEQAFDDSLSSWFDHLPFPVASALWTAEIAASPSEQQRAYLHAWEAIVAFHATVLLSATRSDPSSGREVESAIREALREQHLNIERASFGTWVAIIEKTSKNFRRALENDDADEVARVRRAFGDLGRAGIDRLISKNIVSKFKELNNKRNRWSGHAGYTAGEELRTQVVSLESDLRDLRQLLGNVWRQLLLVRAGSAKRGRDGLVQTAEVAVGIRSPFPSKDFSVGDVMLDGELYLVREGSQSPLRLAQFVQLRASPSDAQYTSYFYNRTEGNNVRMITYQYGPGGELQDDVASFREDFGALASD